MFGDGMLFGLPAGRKPGLVEAEESLVYQEGRAGEQMSANDVRVKVPGKPEQRRIRFRQGLNRVVRETLERTIRKRRTIWQSVTVETGADEDSWSH